jgi:hypothetical protein
MIMGYPPQNPQYPGQPYGQPQQGYGQPPAQQQQYVPGGPPQQYGAPEGVAAAFDFGQVYGQADPTAGSIDNGTYPAIVESAEFDRTQSGDKWAWTVKFQITSAPYVGRRRTKTLSINPTKNDGSPNGVGLGITFRQAHTLGVPLGPPIGEPGEVPVWQQVPQQATPEQTLAAAGRLAAQMMTGRPCRIVLGTRPAHGDYPESQEIKDIKPAMPGDPTSLPAGAGQAAPPAPGGFQPPQGMQPPPGQPVYPQQAAPPQGYPQPGAQPVGPAQQPPWGGQPQQAPQAPAPYGAPPGTFPGQVAPQGPTGYGAGPAGPPSTPAAGYSAAGAPPNPGQPGNGQFTPQGQAQQWADPNGQPAQGPAQAQPAAAAPPWANGQQAAPQQAAQQPQPGTPPQPPWAQQQ